MDVKIFDVDNNEIDCDVKVTNDGDFIQCQFVYKGNNDVLVSKAVLCTHAHGIAGNTLIYAEAYNKLSQTIGTLKNPTAMTAYTDAEHYKLPVKDGYFTAYSLFIAYTNPATMYAYTSTNRFAGKIHFNETEIILEQDLGNILIKPHEIVELEEIFIKTGDANKLFEIVSSRLAFNHPSLICNTYPTGWCSWYCFGPEYTSEDVEHNMEKAQENFNVSDKSPFFIQIDDGYQTYMGDYLDISGLFPNFENLIQSIHDKGFEPALWVAPFIAQKESELFRNHPEYFVKDETGNPLSSGDCSFGGWRCDPWYMLDGTNPQVLEHLKNLFATLRKKYGIKYFKLDANMWGAFPFGKRFDNTKTYVQAYRDAMAAIIEGAGNGAYILGCNAPVWASIGLVHGMRIAGDVDRTFDNFKTLHSEISHRNWQNNTLWINDPDCVVTINNSKNMIQPDGSTKDIVTHLSEDEFDFHCCAILASGGAILSGDDMCLMSSEKIGRIQKLIATPKIAAQYDDNTNTLGRQKTPIGDIITVFNSTEGVISKKITLDDMVSVYDFWTDVSLYENVDEFTVSLNPHSAKAFLVKK